MGKLSNILTMAELLNSGQKFTIEELSNQLEVTPRMIRFYKEELEKAGIYIDTIYGPYGGYVLNQKIRLPQRKFSQKDVKLLESIQKEVGKNHQEELMLLIDKMRGVFMGSQKESVPLNEGSLLKYNIISRAIKEKRKVRIRYYSYQKGERDRVIHPYQMFLLQNGWAVAAFCELKNDLRHFEFRRISDISLLEESFSFE